MHRLDICLGVYCEIGLKPNVIKLRNNTLKDYLGDKTQRRRGAETQRGREGERGWTRGSKKIETQRCKGANRGTERFLSSKIHAETY